MTIAILSLLGTLIPFCIWLYKHHAEKSSDPVELHRKDYRKAEDEVTKPNTMLSDSLDELERLERLREIKDRYK